MRIDGYHKYFSDVLAPIEAVPNTMYRKLLTVAVLDTFGRAYMPKAGNFERFTGVVRDMCDWRDAARISLPQLALCLAASPKSGSTPLTNEVYKRLGDWEIGRINRISDDPSIDDLRKVAAATDDKVLTQHQHLNLLYAYRNSLVHEFREPGYDFGDFGGDSTPSYINVDDEDGNHQWELGYPTRFFADLAARALANLKEHFEKNGIDPYSMYDFGSRWRRG